MQILQSPTLKKFVSLEQNMMRYFYPNGNFSRCLGILIFSITFFNLLEGFIDLELMRQDFVLETKKLTIPKYPDAFNPSIIRWQNSLLLSFRARDPLTGITNIVGFHWLDDEFELKGDPQILNIAYCPLAGSMIQDPRLISINGKLYIIYSDIWKFPIKDVRRMYVGEVQYDGLNFFANYPEVLLHFDGEGGNKYEKNWVPFEYNGDLLLSYTINPHKVLYPIPGTKKCVTIAWSEIAHIWEWGELRGGTPAFLVDGEYLAFFHSSLLLRTHHSKGRLMPHYVMGAYTFQPYPPFAITKISPEIIVGKNFYNGPSYNTWKPIRVVFPCGFVFDKTAIWIAYGRQDHEIWIAKLDKKKLLQSLVPTQKIR